MAETSAQKLVSLVRMAALTIAAGTLLSGPVLTAIVMIYRPQPLWQGTETFIQHFHWLQVTPFILGFALLGGSCLFVTAAGRLISDDCQRVLSDLALIAVAIYGSLIVLNYTIQIAYIPTAIKSSPEYIPLLTMSNPNSLCWAVEMFGYLFQGIAFWLIYPAFHGWKYYQPIKILLFSNLILSIGGAMAAMVNVAWAMTPFGLLMFIVWNLTVFVLMLLIALRQPTAGELDQA